MAYLREKPELDKVGELEIHRKEFPPVDNR